MFILKSTSLYASTWRLDGTRRIADFKMTNNSCTFLVKKKGEAGPLQTQKGPEGSRKLRFPDFMTTAQDGGKVYPQEILLVLICVRG